MRDSLPSHGEETPFIRWFGRSSISADLTTLDIGGGAVGFNWLPVFAAERSGIFDRNGLAVSIRRLGTVDKATAAAKNGEIQLTDALRTLARKSPMFALEIEGQRHDAGDKLGFLIATVEFGLKNPALGAEFRDYLSTRMHTASSNRRA